MANESERASPRSRAGQDGTAAKADAGPEQTAATSAGESNSERQGPGLCRAQAQALSSIERGFCVAVSLVAVFHTVLIFNSCGTISAEHIRTRQACVQR